MGGKRLEWMTAQYGNYFVIGCIDLSNEGRLQGYNMTFHWMGVGKWLNNWFYKWMAVIVLWLLWTLSWGSNWTNQNNPIFLVMKWSNSMGFIQMCESFWLNWQPKQGQLNQKHQHGRGCADKKDNVFFQLREWSLIGIILYDQSGQNLFDKHLILSMN